jgi:UDP-3-O-[3-hydroxymyristoyl] N-acetylglucosamine deacetylase
VKVVTRFQHTIGQSVSLQGIGVHSGVEARVRLSPAPAHSGIVFVRTDAPEGLNLIPARAENVHQAVNATTLRNAFGVSVGTIEHLLAACAGLEIDNLLVEIDGPELPILDGSAAPFARALQWARIVAQAAPRQTIRILKRVEVSIGSKRAALEPVAHGEGLELDVSVDFAHKSIGAQRLSLALSRDTFLDDLSDARTFGFLHEWDQMRAKGLGLGASLDNTLVFDGEGVVNAEGARHADEAVRHKALDALGDLALAGAAIVGRYVAEQPGHALNAALVQALLADVSAFRLEGGEPALAESLAAAG